MRKREAEWPIADQELKGFMEAKSKQVQVGTALVEYSLTHQALVERHRRANAELQTLRHKRIAANDPELSVREQDLAVEIHAIANQLMLGPATHPHRVS